jgi:peptidoglycan/LPS O-acetylase OafA/YrhL
MGFVYKEPGSLQMPFWTGLAICSVFLMSVIAVSDITYYLIEKPCRKWINKNFVNQDRKMPVVNAL